MPRRIFRVAASAMAASLWWASGVEAQARDRVSIVGSSTVFPYSQAAAEEFAASGEHPAPSVESTGTGGGVKQFCSGVGANTPDVVGASRAITESEKALCLRNGVDDVAEIFLGRDGITMASSRNAPTLRLSASAMFSALAAEIPSGDSSGGGDALIANPHATWRDVDSSLPDAAIRVFGPPPTSGTRDAFVEIAMHEGCEELAYFASRRASMESRAFKALVKESCSRMRSDGAFIEAGENDNLIVRRLMSDESAYGIFGYSFFHENSDRLRAAAIEGVTPSAETIADGSYPLTRPLYVYVKNAHRRAIPGLGEFVEELLSEAASGEEGYLLDRGLSPPSFERREAARRAFREGANLFDEDFDENFDEDDER